MELSNYAKSLGVNLEEVREHYARVSCKVTKEHLNLHNTAHGSLIFSLADIAFEIISNYNRDSVALQMSIYFRKPAKEGDKIIAEAFEESEGKTTSLYKILVKNEEGKEIASVNALVYHLDQNK
ncbi:hotdog fold thioesterase [Acidianus manzaensis]|uniref:Phenylacetic acid degradation protein n=1 Tax=Acidianus manzaensis TaxID=282676 RepID=A0A1W6JWS1_9CREN|nr:hotdog fold thioesterase [Acidianus manzaensis]ARM74713.1 phenylacetic acid degradation protein [Acidianus manzaensis]